MSGRGKGKFKFRAQPRKEGADDTAQTSTAVKLMIIGAKPTIAEVNRWQDAAMEWGGANVRNGLHKVADRTNPGELPELPELEPPDREGDGYRTPDVEDFMIMNDEEVEILDRPAFERQKSRNKERYDEDRKEFVSELTRWKKKQDEIQEDTITFYNHLKSHLSAEARTKMKEKVPNCFAVENPKILMDALRATFLTETTGVIGNRIALENSRHRVMAMRQGRAVSSSIYLESHSGELESLHQLELEAGMTEDEWEIAWSIARVIDHIIWGLDDVRFGFWNNRCSSTARITRHPQVWQICTGISLCGRSSIGHNSVISQVPSALTHMSCGNNRTKRASRRIAMENRLTAMTVDYVTTKGNSVASTT